MMKNPRVLAGTTLVTAVIATSLAIDAGSTAALWQLEADVETTGTITTGSIGFAPPTEVESWGYIPSAGVYEELYVFRDGDHIEYNVIEIDANYHDWVALYTSVTPEFNGTDLDAAVLTAHYAWPLSHREGLFTSWANILVDGYVSLDGVNYHAVSLTGSLSAAATGLTLRVLIWPESVAHPASWPASDIVTYASTPTEVTFRLRVVNYSHTDTWVIGASSVTDYRPVDPVGGTLTLSLTQADRSGVAGGWNYTTSLPIPTLYNDVWGLDGHYLYENGHYLTAVTSAPSEDFEPTELPANDGDALSEGNLVEAPNVDTDPESSPAPATDPAEEGDE